MSCIEPRKGGLHVSGKKKKKGKKIKDVIHDMREIRNNDIQCIIIFNLTLESDAIAPFIKFWSEK